MRNCTTSMPNRISPRLKATHTQIQHPIRSIKLIKYLPLIYTPKYVVKLPEMMKDVESEKETKINTQLHAFS